MIKRNTNCFALANLVRYKDYELCSIYLNRKTEVLSPVFSWNREETVDSMLAELLINDKAMGGHHQQLELTKSQCCPLNDNKSITLGKLCIVDNGLMPVLGQQRSHATEQSHRQSRATTQHDQTQCPKPPSKMLVKWNKQPQEEPKVHTVMVPMAQPVGGWHVTSRTKHHEQNVSRPCPQDMGPTQ